MKKKKQKQRSFDAAKLFSYNIKSKSLYVQTWNCGVAQTEHKPRKVATTTRVTKISHK